jgi:hypothetical protein
LSKNLLLIFRFWNDIYFFIKPRIADIEHQNGANQKIIE